MGFRVHYSAFVTILIIFMIALAIYIGEIIDRRGNRPLHTKPLSVKKTPKEYHIFAVSDDENSQAMIAFNLVTRLICD
jgi:MFS-type transporter involved in bile tolerance (Atg22 family)